MKKILSLGLCLALLTSLMCLGPALADEGKPISIMVPLYAPEAPQKDAPVWEALETLTGETLDIQFVPSDSMNDKLNIAIASNTLPDAVCVLNLKSNSFLNAVRSGMFWDLTDILASTPALQQAYTPGVLYNASIDGRNYVLPRTRIMTRTGIVLRQDWLKQVGMEIPDTLDELYAVLTAFAKEDFDGNGKQDTIPFVDAYNAGGIQSLGLFAVWAGLDNGWTKTDAGFVPVYSTEAFMERVLKFYRKLYTEGLMNQDFATIKQQQIYEIVNADLGGAYVDATDTIRTRFEPILTAKKKLNETTILGDLFAYTSVMTTPEGETTALGSSGFTGAYAFPKSSLKTEEDLQRVLNVFLAIDSAEGQNLTKWGVEGVTFDLVEGVPTVRNQDTYTVDVQVFSHLGLSYFTNPLYTPGNVSEFERVQTADQIACTQYAVINPMEPYTSETDSTRGSELIKLVLDAQVKYIMDITDEEGYWKAVDQYMKAGGDQIVAEYNEIYNAAQGK